MIVEYLSIGDMSSLYKAFIDTSSLVTMISSEQAQAELFTLRIIGILRMKTLIASEEYKSQQYMPSLPPNKMTRAKDQPGIQLYDTGSVGMKCSQTFNTRCATDSKPSKIDVVISPEWNDFCNIAFNLNIPSYDITIHGSNPMKIESIRITFESTPTDQPDRGVLEILYDTTGLDIGDVSCRTRNYSYAHISRTITHALRYKTAIWTSTEGKRYNLPKTWTDKLPQEVSASTRFDILNGIGEDDCWPHMTSTEVSWSLSPPTSKALLSLLPSGDS
jgi:hypothetical protein